MSDYHHHCSNFMIDTVLVVYVCIITLFILIAIVFVIIVNILIKLILFNNYNIMSTKRSCNEIKYFQCSYIMIRHIVILASHLIQ